MLGGVLSRSQSGRPMAIDWSYIAQDRHSWALGRLDLSDDQYVVPVFALQTTEEIRHAVRWLWTRPVPIVPAWRRRRCARKAMASFTIPHRMKRPSLQYLLRLQGAASYTLEDPIWLCNSSPGKTSQQTETYWYIRRRGLSMLVYLCCLSSGGISEANSLVLMIEEVPISLPAFPRQ